MIDDGDLWRDTLFMVGLAALTTLNALERAGLLDQPTPLRDLGVVLAILGLFWVDNISVTGDVPVFDGMDKEECWPYTVVDYAKRHGIEIAGVYEIEKRFVEEYDNAEEAQNWKAKPGVDRWGWKTKVGSSSRPPLSVPELALGL
jgi:hypothetical protein